MQEWIKPRGKKLDAKPVTDLKGHKISINAVNLNRRESSRTPTNYDPRPSHLRATDTKALDILRADLLSINQPCAFNCILVPSVERALHDHTYSRKVGVDTMTSLVSETRQQPTITIACPWDAEEMREGCRIVKEELQVSSEVRQKIEQATRLQSQCCLWFEVRQKRITGYKCGQIQMRSDFRTKG